MNTAFKNTSGVAKLSIEGKDVDATPHETSKKEYQKLISTPYSRHLDFLIFFCTYTATWKKLLITQHSNFQSATLALLKVCCLVENVILPLKKIIGR